ncbi:MULTISPECIES: peptidoglycan recognition protein [unclassified Streptomyces]|uniref:peptidoglycan recognition protein family protein n=1 Tax=Streptomyces TaxID=1883 RepID=UPI00190301B4|nr:MULTISPECIES: N-acetylmuramoyl-L-alanine amidase [unclassified Streptomyces]MCU4748679.1 N-acetylmuramoyl-L-alanine amidase [Streptomyces sp. G-5]QQN79181.1 N-acetylmuramoyl-L-alanine amidase [Streptomyces sp. XC 2026]
MRAFIASTIGVTCAAALAVPLVVPLGTGSAVAASAPRTAATTTEASGIQSLPLEPLAPEARSADGGGEVGLPARETEPFSLLGVVWADAAEELHGEAEVRTRALDGEWSGWQPLETHTDHAPDRNTAEAAAGALRGGTAPLWVGASDAVEVRVWPEDGTAPVTGLPEGLSLELIDPDTGMGAAVAVDGAGTSVATADRGATPATGVPGVSGVSGDGAQSATTAYPGPRPPITTRAGWGADESLRESAFAYTDMVKTVFVHHTAGGNNYSCAQAPALIRGIYRYHVQSQGWRDVGYNFFVDKCGTIYEGRAGGVDRAVQGAHTAGFNHNSMGVALLGSHGSSAPTKEALNAVSQLSAWKLGLSGINPKSSRNRTSMGGGLYAKGVTVKMANISGHRDGFATECPGEQLYAQLPAIRSTAAGFQGR